MNRVVSNLRIASFIVLAITFYCQPIAGQDEPELVTASAPDNEGWVGQRMKFQVALRGKGPFVGASSFTLPQIDRTIIVHDSSVVVSSEEHGEDSWFVQTHHFSLFSQQEGTIEVPAFEARYSHRNGFTGPAVDERQQTQPVSFQLKRPQNVPSDIFLITSEDFEVTEKWDDLPSKLHVGDVVRRTISQTANEMVGLALPPPPQVQLDTVRVYYDAPKVSNQTERSTLRASREDRLTYSIQKPGAVTIPEITYAWWNPKTEKLITKTLPAKSFTVVANAEDNEPLEESSSRLIWMVSGLVLMGLCFALVFYFRFAIVARYHAILQSRWNRQRTAARELMRACESNDAALAERAWTTWRGIQRNNIPVHESLRVALAELDRHLYGPNVKKPWVGTDLAKAFRNRPGREAQRTRSKKPDLPPLNP